MNSRRLKFTHTTHLWLTHPFSREMPHTHIIYCCKTWTNRIELMHFTCKCNSGSRYIDMKLICNSKKKSAQRNFFHQSSCQTWWRRTCVHQYSLLGVHIYGCYAFSYQYLIKEKRSSEAISLPLSPSRSLLFSSYRLGWAFLIWYSIFQYGTIKRVIYSWWKAARSEFVYLRFWGQTVLIKCVQNITFIY